MHRAAGLVAALALAGCGSAAPPTPAAANQARPAAPAAGLPALTGRVVDMANLLSPAEEAGLTDELAALERRTTDQLVIVTTPSLGGQAIEAYGLMLGNGWGVGQRGKDNGVLLIVAPAERKTRIEVGFGLEAILTDMRAQAIIDREMVPQFRENRWPEGIQGGTRAIIATLVAHEREPRGRRR